MRPDRLLLMLAVALAVSIAAYPAGAAVTFTRAGRRLGTAKVTVLAPLRRRR